MMFNNVPFADNPITEANAQTYLIDCIGYSEQDLTYVLTKGYPSLLQYVIDCDYFIDCQRYTYTGRNNRSRA